jgi:hypothetical protein
LRWRNRKPKCLRTLENRRALEERREGTIETDLSLTAVTSNPVPIDQLAIGKRNKHGIIEVEVNGPTLARLVMDFDVGDLARFILIESNDRILAFGS